MKRLIVGAVIDSSSSMESQKRSVIEGYNEYLGTLSKEPAEVRLSRTHFDDDVRVEHGAQPLAAVPRLTMANYNTVGSTALYDGLGETILRLEKEAGAEDRVLVILMTDGDENMSSRWDEVRLHAKVKEKESTGRWTFIMLGANIIDVAATARNIGILPGNVLSFQLSEDGIAGAFEQVSDGTVRLLTDGSESSKTFFQTE